MEKEILDCAAELFSQKGFAATSLQDVATALGMSRPALYYYVSNKDALLEKLVENQSRRDARALKAIQRKRDAGPEEKLREMARAIVMNAGTNPKQSRILIENRHHLPDHLAQADRAAERSILSSLLDVIEDGVQHGVFRDVEPRSAALAIIGMCIWTAWWVQDDKAPSLERLTEQISDQAVSSVLHHGRSNDRSSGPALVRAMREDLLQLERIIGPAESGPSKRGAASCSTSTRSERVV